MELRYTLEKSWPKLSWVAILHQYSDRIFIRHGEWVETNEKFFVEGVWNDNFEEGLFVDATWFLGSGGIVDESTVTFSTPSHMLERLHWIRLDTQLCVSNSLVLLLTQISGTIDYTYPFYVHDLSSMVSGFNYAASTIPTSHGHDIGLCYFSNINVDRNLNTMIVRKRQAHSVKDYSQYIGWLRRSVVSVVQNGKSSQREIPIRPLSTISSGYDSPACTILAKEGECKEAITFSESRPSPGIVPEEDRGTQIANLLNIKVTILDRTSYQNRTDFPEAEFLVGGVGGEDVVLSAAETLLPGRLLITGFLGDTIWGKDPRVETAEDLSFTYPAGASLSEFRLRIGFVHFPIPQAHHFLLPDIAAITASEEMGDWSVGGDYDRPIPRRLVEEEGVPRELFGNMKRAASQPFNRFGSPDEVMGPRSFEDFRNFMTDIPSLRPRDFLRGRREEIQRRTLVRFSGIPWVEDLIHRIGSLPSPGLESPIAWYHWTFHWAFRKLEGRY